MNRSELNQVAHGLKAVRPNGYHERDTVDNTFITDRCELWESTVISMADHLQLKEKARSNFLAGCGYRPEEAQA